MGVAKHVQEFRQALADVTAAMKQSGFKLKDVVALSDPVESPAFLAKGLTASIAPAVSAWEHSKAL